MAASRGITVSLRGELTGAAFDVILVTDVVEVVVDVVVEVVTVKTVVVAGVLSELRIFLTGNLNSYQKQNININ